MSDNENINEGVNPPGEDPKRSSVNPPSEGPVKWEVDPSAPAPSEDD